MEETKHIKTNPFPDTYGLVLCGGQSTRMGSDKSMLQYYEKPQRYHVYNMLLSFCEKVFISCNEAQAGTIEHGYHFLKDDPAFSNIGPMAALLTAFTQYPKKDLLLIGCDYPFLTAAELQKFLASCGHKAAAFFNDEAGIYEPLLAWYPALAVEQLNKMHETKQFSLQHFLNDNQAAKFYPANKNSITSVDTHEAFIKAQHLIK